MKKEFDLNDIFDKIDLENINQSVVDEIPENKLVEYFAFNKLQEEISENIKFKPIGKSKPALFFFAFFGKIMNDKQFQINPIYKTLFDLIIQFAENLIIKEYHEKNFRKLHILIYNQYYKLNANQSAFIDTQKIFAAFYDYYFLKEMKNQFLLADNELKLEITKLLVNFVGSCKNAQIIWGKDESQLYEFANKKVTTHNSQNEILQFYFSPDQIEALLENLRKYENINRIIFNDTLNAEDLNNVLSFIDHFDLVANYKFEIILDILNDVNFKSNRKRMLFIYEILEMFQIPKTMSVEDEEAYFKRNENSTIASLNLTKIRIAEELTNFQK